MKCNKAIANLIRENKIHQIPSQIQMGMKDGMVLFDRSLEDLVKAGKISRSDMLTFLGKDDDTGTDKKAG
jgi:twitching motility protein PilT